ncbi:MAG TPA: SRPBCC domain-containing protein [Thermoplasmata archaeon]|nr:SRPBCC domain-containing protein [Thermoplasmata archaeon]
MCNPVHHEIDLRAKPSDVYEAFLDSRRHARISGFPARMSSVVGKRFTAGGDYIVGYNLDLVPGKRIVQAWRATDWPKGCYSILSIGLAAKGKGTRLTLDHVGIPESHRAGIDTGWMQHYLNPMAKFFE